MTSARLHADAADRPQAERRADIARKARRHGRDRYTVPMRRERGTRIPRHRHPRDERIFVPDGRVSDDTDTCSCGNCAWRPPGSIHRVTSPGGALGLACTSGGIRGGQAGWP